MSPFVIVFFLLSLELYQVFLRDLLHERRDIGLCFHLFEHVLAELAFIFVVIVIGASTSV